MDLLSSISQDIGLPIWILYIVLAWSLFWKALALWKSARRNSPGWFIAILLINSIGILEILYIYLFSEIKLPEVKDNIKENKISSSKISRSKKRV